MSTDLFQAAFTPIGAIVRAGEATFVAKKIGAEGDWTITVQDITVQYSEKIKWQLLPGGSVIAFIPPGSGSISIGTLCSADLSGFIDDYGDVCNLNHANNKITITGAADVVTDDEDANANTKEIIESCIAICHDCKINGWVMTSRVEGMLVATKMTIEVLNIEELTIA